MILELDEFPTINNPSLEEIKNSFYSLDSTNCFLCLRDFLEVGENFVQILRNGNHNYTVEYWQESEDKIKQSVQLNESDCLYILEFFSKGIETWKSEYKFEDITPYIRMLPVGEDGYVECIEYLDEDFD